MILDEVTIKVKAGNGGDGAVSFRREKFVPKGGPDGGNGGKGGDIIFTCVSDFSALNQFRNKKEIKANNGVNGGKKKKTGGDADDLIIRIPLGTRIKDVETGKEFEMNEIGETVTIVKGGKGGLGSFELRSPTNTTPRVAEDGEPGEEKTLFLNLQYIAEIGLVGVPNSGKSSLLNALTNAQAKIGDYPFTTLEPNLGNMEGVIIADIPGLIEGASKGRGLGIKFLKHIEKTKVLLHCIDSAQPNITETYKTIKKELEEYSQNLKDKEEIILLTKTDLISFQELKDQVKLAKKLNPNTYTISIFDKKNIETLKQKLLKK
ncbi:MAG TPA: GTPase ObgE [Candidatus Nitrosocosmicus sp.]|nr:GTPase ObgE [Candidatus Nitrosocosmicus sp.]